MFFPSTFGRVIFAGRLKYQCGIPKGLLRCGEAPRRFLVIVVLN